MIKMKIMTVLVFGFILFGRVGPSFSEVEFSPSGTLVDINTLIKRSLEHEAGVRRAEARLKKEEELYQAVKRSAFPRLATDLYAAEVTQHNRGIVFWTSEIRLPLFEGGKSLHEEKKKSYEVSSEKLNLESARQDAAYQFKALYIALAREKESTRLAQAWVKEAEKLHASMKALFGKGLINQETLYRWETAYRSAQSELVKHKEAMDYAEALLRELTQASESERIAPDRLDVLRQGEFDFQSLVSQMRTQNPLYQMVKLRAKAREEEIRILRTDRFPKLGLTTRFNLARDSFIDQNRFEIGLVSRWNIWDFGVLSHEIKAKQAEVEEAQAEGLIKTNGLEHDLRKAVGDLKVACAKIAAIQTLLKEKKEAYANGKTRFIALEGSESELFDSFVALTQAQIALVEAFAEYQLIEIHLRRLVGSGAGLA